MYQADGTSLQSNSIGEVVLTLDAGATCTVSNVRVVAGLSVNLLSTGQFIESGCDVICTQAGATVTKRSTGYSLFIPKVGRLFLLGADCNDVPSA
jgi:hypothetical protein